MNKYVLKKIEVISEGYYPVTITSVEAVTGEFGQQEKFTLSLQGNRKLPAWASASGKKQKKGTETGQTVTVSNPNTSIINPITQLAELDERRNQNDYRI